MRVGVLGTGMVGRAISAKLRELGHDVLVGSRTAGDDAVPFAEAAAHGALVFNCTAGTASLEALAAAGEENLAGKVLVDVANALDSSQGRPPILAVSNTDSLGEQIQRAFPQAKVVKALNTVNASVMVAARPRARVARRLRLRQRRGGEGSGPSCYRASGGPPTRSSTSATSPPRAVPRCTCRSGCG